LIRCIPELQYDEKKVNDAAIEPHEITHSVDALRYFCVYWTSNADAHSAVNKAHWTADMWQDYNNADIEGKTYLIGKWGNPF
jgi:hypothetical protein